MNYNQLNEAIIKVPKTTLEYVNKYVSSVVYFKIKHFMQYYDRFADQQMRSHPMADKIKANVFAECNKTLKTLASKYGAVNISSQSANNLIGKSIKVPFDGEQYAQELNFKNLSPEIKEFLKTVNLGLKIDNKKDGGPRGSLQPISDNRFEMSVNIKLNRKEIYTSSMQVMSTVYHELQHFVQSSVIKPINSKSRQLQIKKDYDKHNADYMSSGVEFTPQLGNVIDAMSAEAQMLKDEGKLSDDPKTAFNDVLQVVLGREDKYNARPFIIHIYKTSQKRYRTVMTELYKKFMEMYETLEANTDDYEEAPESELEGDVNKLRSLASEAKKSSYLTTKLYGQSLDELSKIDCYNKDQGWKISFGTSYNPDKISMVFHGKTSVERSDIEFKKASDILGILSSMDFSSDDVLELLDEMVHSIDNIDEEIPKLISKLSEWAGMVGLPFNIIDNGIEINGVEFKFEAYDGRVAVESPQLPEMYLISSLKTTTDIFKYILRLMKGNSDSLMKVLNQGESALKIKQELEYM